MNLQLTGKVALITGASKGLGHAIARQLAEEGMRVAIAARSAEPLHTLAAEVESNGGQALAFPVDLSLPDCPAAFLQAALARFGQVDLIVNNAGATKRGDFLELTDMDWAEGYALKFFAAMRLSRAAWPHLIPTQGNIINIAGVGGRTGSAEFTIGGSVNAAMLNLTKSLADRGNTDGVRVNAINPGYIATDRLTTRIQKRAATDQTSHAQAAQSIARESGIPRFGRPEEIASAVAFLASPQAAYLNGAILDIDGGLTRTL